MSERARCWAPTEPVSRVGVLGALERVSRPYAPLACAAPAGGTTGADRRARAVP